MKKSFFLTLFLTALTVASCGGDGLSNSDVNAPLDLVPQDYAGQVNPLGPEAVALGSSIFRANCEACHGALGHGDGPAAGALNPRPTNLAELQSRADDDYLNWRINTGKDGTSMVAWHGVLSEEQIWQVISFLRTLK